MSSRGPMIGSDDSRRVNPYASPLTEAGADPVECDALIRVRRLVRLQDLGRAYRVVRNGKNLGVIRNGQTKAFAFPSGPAELVMLIDWCGSNTVGFDLRPDQTLEFECAGRFRGLGVLMAPFSALFTWRRYLVLRQL